MGDIAKSMMKMMFVKLVYIDIYHYINYVTIYFELKDILELNMYET